MRTNSRHAVEQATAREKGIRRGELAGVRYLMADPIGRALVWRWLQAMSADEAVAFNPNAMVLSLNAGVQKAGHMILGEIREACPELEPKMRAEARDREARLALAENQGDDE